MKIPVLNIQNFRESKRMNEVYVNSFSRHLEFNRCLIDKPHSHDFYLCVLFLEGTGTHEVDFKTYRIGPGRVFFLKPGQTHYWKFDTKPEGIIFFHSQAFYNLRFLGHSLSIFPFYGSQQNPPMLKVPTSEIPVLQMKFQEAIAEYRDNRMMREIKILGLINDIYIQLSRIYASQIDLDHINYTQSTALLDRLEILIDKNFKEEKLPKFYAEQLNITTKHLNRVVKQTVNKTTTELISERVVLEAKRLIVHSKHNLADVAYALEFSDYAYFSKYFKARTGITPKAFQESYK
ncbi:MULTISPECIES: AraC family transcriptional regulator [Flavobacteriaceae]|uniref:helix-turn-helix domain-containing protein n=2 Tax=Flavobacteriales TaxID=200644 RepID=UPI0020764626|nr:MULTISPECIES: helix-turn-helix transcriptional regulator [Allomuricauda]USD24686.1 AraC family transcriptional regulator [Allomuricauda aquimarina]